MRLKIIWVTLLWLAVAGLAACQVQPRIPQTLGTISVGWFGDTSGEIGFDTRTGYTYVLSNGRVFVIKGLELVEELKLPGTERADKILVDEARGWTYIVNQYSANVTVLRGTDIITNVATAGDNPSGIGLDPRSGWAYVVSAYHSDMEHTPLTDPDYVQGHLTVISGTQPIGTLNLGHKLLTHVAVDPAGYVYAGGAGGDVVIVRGMEVLTETRLADAAPNDPDVYNTVTAIDVNEGTGETYILGSFGDVYVWHEGVLVKSFQLDIEQGKRSFYNLLVHPDTGDLYVMDQQQGDVVVVHDGTVIATIPTGHQWTHFAAVDRITGNVYVTNFALGTVTVIHGTRALATIEVGADSEYVAVNPANGWVYVSNMLDNTVSVLGFPK
jgi:DNA-binding beta-propeller fold protein YncE